MKVAVISDIHANRQAFEATLEAVAASDAAELWCLGDLARRGPQPRREQQSGIRRIVAEVRSRGALERDSTPLGGHRRAGFDSGEPLHSLEHGRAQALL